MLTTANKHAPEERAGPAPAFEIPGKPHDLDLFLVYCPRAIDRTGLLVYHRMTMPERARDVPALIVYDES